MKLNEAIEDNRLDEVIGPMATIVISAAVLLLSRIIPKAVKIFKTWAEIKKLYKEKEKLSGEHTKVKAEQESKTRALELAKKILDTQKDDPTLNKIMAKLKEAADKIPEKDPKEMTKWLDQDISFYDKIFKELIDYVKSYTN